MPFPPRSVKTSIDGPGGGVGGVICLERMYVAPVRMPTASMASNAAFSMSLTKSGNSIPCTFPLISCFARVFNVTLLYERIRNVNRWSRVGQGVSAGDLWHL